MTQKKEYVFLDYFKLFCAFLVVGIHTEPFSQWFYLDKAFGTLTRIAVPFFFVATSYFFFSTPLSASRLWKYCKHIFSIYLLWSVVYNVAEWLLHGAFPEHMLLTFLTTGYDHLWFLHACIVSVCLMSFLDFTICKKSRAVAYLLVLASYVLALCISTYYPLFAGSRVITAAAHSRFVRLFGTRSGFFYGLLFVCMGYCFAKENCLRLSAKGNAVAALVCLAMLAAEGAAAVLLLQVSQTILWVFSIPLTFFAFAMCLQIPLPDNRRAVTIRKLSLGIYCVHPLLIMLFGTLLPPLLLFPAVLVLSVVLSGVWYALNNQWASGLLGRKN